LSPRLHTAQGLFSNSVFDGKQSGLRLAVGGLRRCCFLQRRRAHRRHGRRNTGGLRPQPQLLESFRIELPGRIQPVRLLEFPGRFNGRSVPFPVGLSGERTVFRKRLLNLRNAIGSRGFLSALPPAGSPRFSFSVRRAPSFGGGGLRCRTLRPR